MSDKTKDYYDVNDVMEITGRQKSWCYELIRKLRKSFESEFEESITLVGKIPKWYFEEKMIYKKGGDEYAK